MAMNLLEDQELKGILRHVLYVESLPCSDTMINVDAVFSPLLRQLVQWDVKTLP